MFLLNVRQTFDVLSSAIRNSRNLRGPRLDDRSEQSYPVSVPCVEEVEGDLVEEVEVDQDPVCVRVEVSFSVANKLSSSRGDLNL